MPLVRAGRPGLLKTITPAAVVSGSATATATVVNRGPQRCEGSRTGADLIAELERLARMHESGRLTAVEFAAAKERLLSG